MKVWMPIIDAVGGMRSHTETLARGLRDRGHEVTVSLFPIEWQFSTRRLRTLTPPAGADVVVADSWIAHAFREVGARIIACEHHNVHDPAYANITPRYRRLVHETWLKAREKSGFEAAAAIVAVSNFVARTLRNRFPGIEPVVIYNPVNTAFFSPDFGASRSRDNVRLFFAGDLSRRKGADLLPQIMELLGPQFHLYYTGGNRVSLPLPVRDNFHPLGRLSAAQMREQYRLADLFLLPTRYESFGISVAEAMSCGIPVVAADIAALPELVTEGVTGRLCPAGDTQAFAEAIRDLAEKPDIRAAMGRRARAAVGRLFDMADIAREYETLMASVLDRPDPSAV